VDGEPHPQPDSAPSAGSNHGQFLQSDRGEVDVIAGGRPPRFQLPRSLVIALLAVGGIAALAWAAITLSVNDEKSTESPSLTAEVATYQPTRGVLVVDLVNDDDVPVYIDAVQVFQGNSSSESTQEFRQWGWVQVAVVQASLAADYPQTAIGQWPFPPLGPIAVDSDGGSAVLGVSVRPPCGDRGLPRSAHLVVSYHTDTDSFTQKIPDLLDAGSLTGLQQMKRAVCRYERAHPSGRVAPVPLGGVGRHWFNVDGVRLSIRIPSGGWERFGNVSLNKSTSGPQGAEGIIYWTSYPDGLNTDWCRRMPSLGRTSSSTELATKLSGAPGTELVDRPSSLMLGGRPAKLLVLKVRKIRGCDPGYFHSWHDAAGGALWPTTTRGDTIRIWLVNVEGVRLFIAGETHKFALPHREVGPKITTEIQQIVNSIRFG
jgi:hypothetical protein